VHLIPVDAGIRREGNICVTTMAAETNAGRVLATAEGGGIADASHVAIIVVNLKGSLGMRSEVGLAASQVFLLARRILCLDRVAVQALDADTLSVVCGERKHESVKLVMTSNGMKYLVIL